MTSHKLKYPEMIEDKYYNNTQKRRMSNNGVHVIIFVHGFQGNTRDLLLIRNELAVLFPDHFFLMSSANEEFTTGSISEMGSRLASEVTTFLREECSDHEVGRISFIGHSLGGLIIRSCLPHLSEYYPLMHTYVSLSSPHLGYTSKESKIVRMAMWLYK